MLYNFHIFAVLFHKFRAAIIACCARGFYNPRGTLGYDGGV
ncbi:hypothetical protein J2782_003496 [Brucella pseudogrignonensis]|uniref:Uncharacterized protein n=1 Tax=Brucella pseudogrignonensis TaxID=419475 RepID=A0ABU1MCI3_9HYPH|nr:hypothetical protein [Brucella pseudogrignonensis]